MRLTTGRLALVRHIILGFCLSLPFCQKIIGQPSSSAAPSATTPASLAKPDATTISGQQDAGNPVLQLQAILHEEAKEHREYLRDSLDELKWVVGGIVLIGGGILAWLNYKSGKEIRAQVNSRFKASVDDLLDERLGQFNTFLERSRKQVEESVIEVDHVLERIGDYASVWANGFTLLREAAKSAGVEKDSAGLDRALRDAIRQLERLRVFFPHWRHLGILIGRIYKHFLEYEDAIKVLTQVIEEREKRELPHELDYSALVYNRACYRNLEAAEYEKKGQSQRAHALRAEAWQDLIESVGIDAANISEATEDPDFQGLWNDTDRKRDALGKTNRRVTKKEGRAGWLKTKLAWRRKKV